MFSIMSRRVMFSAILVSCIFTFAGCGQKYESEITQHVQKNCVIPDSFKKIDYKADEKNGIAYIDFKSKNNAGVEKKQRIYFTINNDTYTELDTSDIDDKNIEKYLKENPAEFAKCVKNYNQLTKLCDRMMDKQKLMNISSEMVDDLNDNYFAWKDFKRKADSYNKALKDAKDFYDTVPQIIKPQFGVLDTKKYVKVFINGNVLDFSAKSEESTEYPSNN